MYTLFIVIHIVACVLLVSVVLLQAGRSGGFQGLFGSSGEVIFSSSSGSSFLRKLTVSFALVFGVTSIVLTVMTKTRLYRSTVLEHIGEIAPPSAPNNPAPK